MLINWDHIPEGKLHNQSLDMNWARIVFASECHPFLEEAESEPLSGRDLTMAVDLQVLKCIREFFISLA
jgi:hypothetical protein